MDTIALIGGGNMACAIIGGLIQSGLPPARILVVEPHEPQRVMLHSRFGIDATPSPSDALASADLIVWAVKPQTFQEAARQAAQHTRNAVHLSVMAGIRSDDIAKATGSDRIVRAMPNTPALIGRGIAGLYARPAVDAASRQAIEQVLSPTGQTLWVAKEADLDAVTALSGSGPAYVFYFVEAMTAAGEQMGLNADQAKALALATFAGATELANRSPESPATLRAQVTSKGGTTHAAITALQEAGVADHVIAAILAAQKRARELGDEFGR